MLRKIGPKCGLIRTIRIDPLTFIMAFNSVRSVAYTLELITCEPYLDTYVEVIVEINVEI